MKSGINEAKPGDRPRHRIMQFFCYSHLKPELANVSKQFNDLATWIDEQLPDNPEKSVALRKLMEAKDCAVRAVIYKEVE